MIMFLPITSLLHRVHISLEQGCGYNEATELYKLLFWYNGLSIIVSVKSALWHLVIGKSPYNDYV